MVKIFRPVPSGAVIIIAAFALSFPLRPRPRSRKVGGYRLSDFEQLTTPHASVPAGGCNPRCIILQGFARLKHLHVIQIFIVLETPSCP